MKEHNIKISDNNHTFIAIDVETANSFHICQISIVVVINGVIKYTYDRFVKPHENKYNWHCMKVHGIKPIQTVNAPSFSEIYHEIKTILKGRPIVAHNESFDRTTLQKQIAFSGFDYSELEQTEKFECTYRLFKPYHDSAKLNSLCEIYDIELKHHDAGSDAIACAKLYCIFLDKVKI